MIHILVYIITGLLAGTGIGLVGMSAATIVTPLLVTLLGFNAYEAIGIALAADVLASAFSSYTYYKNKHIDIKNGIVMLISTMIFTYIASYLATFISNKFLGNLSVYMCILLGLRLIFKPITANSSSLENRSKSKQIFLSIVFGALIGMVCGIMGVGGGIMILLVLTSVLGYNLKTAVGTSVFIMTFTALTGAIAHIIHSGTNLEAMIICLIFGLVSSRIASKFANKVDDKKLNRTAGTFLVLFGIILLFIKLFGHTL